MSERCNAKTDDGPCPKEPLDGKKRCALHGGLSTGPHKPAHPHGNTNAVQHHVYCRGILSHEISMIPAFAEIRGVDAELVMLRVLLARVLEAEGCFDTRCRMEIGTEGGSAMPDYHLPITTVETEDTPAGTRRKTTRTQAGYFSKIITLTRTIAKLELARVVIAGSHDPLGRTARMHDYMHHFGLSDSERNECDALMTDLHDFGREAAASLGIELEDKPC